MNNQSQPILFNNPSMNSVPTSAMKGMYEMNRIEKEYPNSISNSDKKSDPDSGSLSHPLNPLEEKQYYDPQKIISLKNVHKTYLLGLEGVTALRGVSVDIKEGEFITILGTSGGGKTTMLNIMGTIDKPTKGDVYICGQKIKSSTDDKFLASLRLTKLGFVFQTFNLIQSMTALENVELPMTLMGELSKEKIRERAVDLLTSVGLKERLNHFPNQLSGGEQQRVTISRALSNNPKILLLDEPTGDLDTKSSASVMKILLDLNIHKRITMIMVTHDVALKNYANRVVRMVDGKVNIIEEIDPVKRQENIENLDKEVAMFAEALAAQEAGQMNEEQRKALGVRTGIVQQAGVGSSAQNNQNNNNNEAPERNGRQSKTEERDPSQYPIFQFARFKRAQDVANSILNNS